MNPLQRLYLFLHRRTFRKRLARSRRFPGVRVISVGNLSTGGTGKTPAVRFLAESSVSSHPLVVLRGYGGKAGEEGVLVTDGERILSDYSTAGDEALLLASSPGVRVAAGRNRARLIERFGAGAKIVLLDDAFQNPSVQRDHDLVLLDATIPPHRWSLLPTGRFREGAEALERADSVLLTRVDLVAPEELRRLREFLRERFPSLPVFESVHAFDGVHPPLPPEAKGVGAFCGIGNPGSFFALLEKNGIPLAEKRIFRDHHPFTAKDLSSLPGGEALPWITTEKDLIRIRDREEFPESLFRRLHTLRIRLKILHGEEERFLSTLLGPLYSSPSK